MRKFVPLVLVALFGVNATAQSESEDSSKPVVVVKQQWRFVVRNPALDEDPLGSATAQGERGQFRSAAIRNTDLDRPANVSDVSYKADGQAVTAHYVYEVTLKNTGLRPIVALSMAYVFADPGTAKELARLSLSSQQKIEAGRTKKLSFYSTSPPTGTISAKGSTSERKSPFREWIEIRSVEFAR